MARDAEQDRARPRCRRCAPWCTGTRRRQACRRTSRRPARRAPAPRRRSPPRRRPRSRRAACRGHRARASAARCVTPGGRRRAAAPARRAPPARSSARRPASPHRSAAAGPSRCRDSRRARRRSSPSRRCARSGAFLRSSPASITTRHSFGAAPSRISTAGARLRAPALTQTARRPPNSGIVLASSTSRDGSPRDEVAFEPHQRERIVEVVDRGRAPAPRRARAPARRRRRRPARRAAPDWAWRRRHRPGRL